MSNAYAIRRLYLKGWSPESTASAVGEPVADVRAKFKQFKADSWTAKPKRINGHDPARTAEIRAAAALPMSSRQAAKIAGCDPSNIYRIRSQAHLPLLPDGEWFNDDDGEWVPDAPTLQERVSVMREWKLMQEV